MFDFSSAVGNLDFIFYVYALLMKSSPLKNNQEKKKYIAIFYDKYLK